MLALLSQAIDQSGYEPVSASAHANGQRKTNNVSTFRGSTTPLKPKTIFEIAPAESWAATIDSSRARTLANILNETTDVDMGDVKPFEMPESGMPEIVSGEDMQKSEAEPVLWDLLWPGWNKNLPNPELMDHMYVLPPCRIAPLANDLHLTSQHRSLFPSCANSDTSVPLRDIQGEDGFTCYAQGFPQRGGPTRYMCSRSQVHRSSLHVQSGG